MTWLHLFLVLCALHGVWADEVVSDVFPKVCAFLPNTRLVGEDIHERPILRLPSPSACCDACLNYKGEEGCVAYTFFFRNGLSECWLKRDAVVAEFSEEGDSGFPNFYHNDAYPDLSSDLDVLFSGFWDLSRVPFRFSLQREMNGWRFKASVGDTALNSDALRSSGNFFRALPESCSRKHVTMNWAFVGQDVIRLPILNLKCPDDCLKACNNHQGATVDIEMLYVHRVCGAEESGRYSCVAFNFKFDLPVTECWLKSAPLFRKPIFGMACGTSERSGFELGKAPEGHIKMRDTYRQLIEEGKKCLDPSLISV